MANWDFPYHTFEAVYPEHSSRVQFGRGYEFVTRPSAPDQVTWKLYFRTMVFFANAAGKPISSMQPQINMLRLIEFYELKGLHEVWTYPHLIKGNIQVRFRSPLTYRLTEGGLGTVDPFSLELIEQP